MRLTRRIRINAPQHRVWEMIDDDSKLPLWMAHLVAVRYPDGKPENNPVGARFIHELRQGDQTSSYGGEITEYQRGELLAMMVRPEAFAMHSVYHLSGDEDWTLLEFGCDVKPMTWRGYLMVWWARRLLNSIIDQQLARLKLVAEGYEL